MRRGMRTVEEEYERFSSLMDRVDDMSVSSTLGESRQRKNIRNAMSQAVPTQSDLTRRVISRHENRSAIEVNERHTGAGLTSRFMPSFRAEKYGQIARMEEDDRAQATLRANQMLDARAEVANALHRHGESQARRRHIESELFAGLQRAQDISVNTTDTSRVDEIELVDGDAQRGCEDFSTCAESLGSALQKLDGFGNAFGNVLSAARISRCAHSAMKGTSRTVGTSTTLTFYSGFQGSETSTSDAVSEEVTGPSTNAKTQSDGVNLLLAKYQEQISHLESQLNFRTRALVRSMSLLESSDMHHRQRIAEVSASKATVEEEVARLNIHVQSLETGIGFTSGWDWRDAADSNCDKMLSDLLEKIATRQEMNREVEDATSGMRAEAAKRKSTLFRGINEDTSSLRQELEGVEGRLVQVRSELKSVRNDLSVKDQMLSDREAQLAALRLELQTSQLRFGEECARRRELETALSEHLHRSDDAEELTALREESLLFHHRSHEMELEVRRLELAVGSASFQVPEHATKEIEDLKAKLQALRSFSSAQGDKLRSIEKESVELSEMVAHGIHSMVAIIEAVREIVTRADPEPSCTKTLSGLEGYLVSNAIFSHATKNRIYDACSQLLGDMSAILVPLSFRHSNEILKSTRERIQVFLECDRPLILQFASKAPKFSFTIPNPTKPRNEPDVPTITPVPQSLSSLKDASPQETPPPQAEEKADTTQLREGAVQIADSLNYVESVCMRMIRMTGSRPGTTISLSSGTATMNLLRQLSAVLAREVAVPIQRSREQMRLIGQAVQEFVTLPGLGADVIDVDAHLRAILVDIPRQVMFILWRRMCISTRQRVGLRQAATSLQEEVRRCRATSDIALYEARHMGKRSSYDRLLTQYESIKNRFSDLRRRYQWLYPPKSKAFQLPSAPQTVLLALTRDFSDRRRIATAESRLYLSPQEEVPDPLETRLLSDSDEAICALHRRRLQLLSELQQIDDVDQRHLDKQQVRLEAIVERQGSLTRSGSAGRARHAATAEALSILQRTGSASSSGSHRHGASPQAAKEIPGLSDVSVHSSPKATGLQLEKGHPQSPHAANDVPELCKSLSFSDLQDEQPVRGAVHADEGVAGERSSIEAKAILALFSDALGVVRARVLSQQPPRTLPIAKALAQLKKSDPGHADAFERVLNQVAGAMNLEVAKFSNALRDHVGPPVPSTPSTPQPNVDIPAGDSQSHTTVPDLVSNSPNRGLRPLSNRGKLEDRPVSPHESTHRSALRPTSGETPKERTSAAPQTLEELSQQPTVDDATLERFLFGESSPFAPEARREVAESPLSEDISLPEDSSIDTVPLATHVREIKNLNKRTEQLEKHLLHAKQRLKTLLFENLSSKTVVADFRSTQKIARKLEIVVSDPTRFRLAREHVLPQVIQTECVALSALPESEDPFDAKPKPKRSAPSSASRYDILRQVYAHRAASPTIRREKSVECHGDDVPMRDVLQLT